MNSQSMAANFDAHTPLTQLLETSVTLIEQGLHLVDNLSSDRQLSTLSHHLPQSTIGKHLRHVRDHFKLLAACMQSGPPHILSYDVRERDAPMEGSLRIAREELMSVIRLLEKTVPNVRLNDPITLNAVTPSMQVFETTFGRELWFAGLHTIHHWSMVRVIATEHNITLSEDFGYAPATLLYKKEKENERAKL